MDARPSRKIGSITQSTHVTRISPTATSWNSDRSVCGFEDRLAMTPMIATSAVQAVMAAVSRVPSGMSEFRNIKRA